MLQLKLEKAKNRMAHIIEEGAQIMLELNELLELEEAIRDVLNDDLERILIELKSPYNLKKL